MAGRYLNVGEIMLANSMLRHASREHHRTWNLSHGPRARVFDGRFFVAYDEDYRSLVEEVGWALDLFDVYVAFEDGAITRLHRVGFGTGWPTHEAAEADLLAAIENGQAEVCERCLPHLKRRWKALLGDLTLSGLYTRTDAERIAVELTA